MCPISATLHFHSTTFGHKYCDCTPAQLYANCIIVTLQIVCCVTHKVLRHTQSSIILEIYYKNKTVSEKCLILGLITRQADKYIYHHILQDSY